MNSASSVGCSTVPGDCHTSVGTVRLSVVALMQVVQDPFAAYRDSTARTGARRSSATSAGQPATLPCRVPDFQLLRKCAISSSTTIRQRRPRKRRRPTRQHRDQHVVLQRDRVVRLRRHQWQPAAEARSAAGRSQIARRWPSADPAPRRCTSRHAHPRDSPTRPHGPGDHQLLGLPGLSADNDDRLPNALARRVAAARVGLDRAPARPRPAAGRRSPSPARAAPIAGADRCRSICG